MAVWGDELCGCTTIQVGDQAREVGREAKELQDPDQLFVVRGECPLEIQVAQDNVFFVGVCFLQS